jgi:hypothetical protein
MGIARDVFRSWAHRLRNFLTASTHQYIMTL